jgi:hypothetical protein
MSKSEIRNPKSEKTALRAGLLTPHCAARESPDPALRCARVS